MMNNKVIAIIAVVLLNVIAGATIGSTYFSGASEYKKALKSAQDYYEKNLCTLSSESYKRAIEERDSVELRLALLDVYSKGIDSGEMSNKYSVCSEVAEYINLFPKDEKIYVAVCEFLYKYEQYEDCATVLKKGNALKFSSDAFKAVTEKVRYVYQDEYSMFDTVTPVFDGCYVAGSEGIYNIVTTGDSEAVDEGLSYATPITDEYSFVKKSDPNGRVSTYIINKKNIRQHYFDNKFTTSTGVGKVDVDNSEKYVLALESSGEYKYYDINGNIFIDKTFKYAGRFRNNVAAVMENNNQWRIINSKGEYVSDTTFKDVVLNDYDYCSPMGLIIAADSSGKYHVYNLELKQIGDFSCDGAKAFVGNCAAFKQGNKWGFVRFTEEKTGSNKGKLEIIIKPQYDDAKSFSNGIAAVNVNGLWGFIDASGKTVIETKFEDAGYLSDSGLLFVKNKGYWTGLQMYYVEKSENK